MHSSTVYLTLNFLLWGNVNLMFGRVLDISSLRHIHSAWVLSDANNGTECPDDGLTGTINNKVNCVRSAIQRVGL